MKYIRVVRTSDYGNAKVATVLTPEAEDALLPFVTGYSRFLANESLRRTGFHLSISAKSSLDHSAFEKAVRGHRLCV
jgi:hypothetical protein